MQRFTYTFYAWNMAVMASRHWPQVPSARCRVYKDRHANPFEGPWILEVTVNGTP